MIESQQVLEWMAMGEVRGEARGEVKGEIKSLLLFLAGRFPPGATPEMEAVIRTTLDVARLESWLELAAKSNSLDDFRQAAGL